MALYVCLSVLLCLCHKSVLRRNEWADIDPVYGMEASDVKSWSRVLTRSGLGLVSFGLGLGLGLEPCGLVNNVIPANS